MNEIEKSLYIESLRATIHNQKIELKEKDKIIDELKKDIYHRIMNCVNIK